MIKLENISKYYHNEGTVTLGLRKVNLEFPNKGFIVLTGESGSGKSTLLNVICGIDTYEEGEMYISGEETSYFDEVEWEEYRRKSVGFIFQNYNLIDSYSVLENVEAALIIQNIKAKERKKRALGLIEKVGLSNHLHHKATKLSGGEKQRLAIARALAKDSSIIAADEPTGNLDSESGKQIIALLYEISKEKLVVVVSHNYEETQKYADRVIRLFDGEVVEDKEIKKAIEMEDNRKFKIETKRKKIPQAFIFANKNLKSQPQKTTLLMMVSLAVTVIVFLVFMAFFSVDGLFGGFLQGGASNSYFPNNYEERLVIIKKDKGILSNQEIDELSGLRYVDSLVKYDVILDHKVYYKDLDETEIRGERYYPLLLDAINQRNLKYGNFPSNENEVVICASFTKEEALKLIGKMVYLYGTPRIDSYSPTAKLGAVQIVGIVEPNPDDYSSYIYVSNNIFAEYYKIFSLNSHPHKITYEDNLGKEVEFYVDVAIDEALSGNEIKITKGSYKKGATNFHFNNLNVDVIEAGGYDQTVYISNELAEFYITEDTKQITLNVKSHDYYSEVIRQVESLNNYYVFSPYDNSGSFSLLETIILVIYATFAFVPILVIVYIIAYLVVKTIMLSKKKDYTILRTIGIDKNSIRKMSQIEIILCFLFSYVIVAAVLIVLQKNAEGEFARTFLGALKVDYYILIFIVNMLFGYLIARRYNKLLMKKSLLVNLKVE
ncbi:MAG TPA: ABC transporter ATP-binding protein/permease [Bacilli bacterium]|nr:ABC transporter ATP-binding protein/permease [Bacilli bacterium]